jgi:hypothetical protein
VRRLGLAVALLLAAVPAPAQTAGSIWQVAANHGAASLGLKGINPTGCWPAGCTLDKLGNTDLNAIVADFEALGVQWVRWEMDANLIDCDQCASLLRLAGRERRLQQHPQSVRLDLSRRQRRCPPQLRPPETCTLLSIMTENGEGSEQIWFTEWGDGTTQATTGVT